MSDMRLKAFFQLRLRTLLILITLIAGGLAFWIRMVEPYKLQTRALEEMEDNGGQVQFALAEPAWLGWIVGEEEFKRVVEYRAEIPAVDDSSIAPIVNFPFLERLYLNKTSVGDAGLTQIARLKNLERLSLWRTKVSGEGLKALAHCQQLRVLDLHETDVSDGDLETLLRLPKLRQLKLGGPVYGPGLQHVARLPRLNRLDLTRTRVSFDDLRHLAGSPVAYLSLASNLPASSAEHLARLQNLHDFDGVLVDADDNTATLISQCRNLESVSIAGTGVTDVTVATLTKLPKLKYIHVHGDLTDESLQTIESASQLTEISLAGRFSHDAIRRLAAKRSNLTGNIRTCDLSNDDRTPLKPPNNLSTRSLISVTPVLHRSGLVDDDGYTRKKLVVSLTWPARLSDWDGFEPNLVESISFAGSARRYYGYHWTLPKVWSLDGLERFPNLRQLSIQRVPASDLARLSEAKNLLELNITDQHLSDEELHSVRLPENLRQLRISPSKVTPAGLAAFQAKYPAVDMHADGHGRIHDGNRWQSPRVGPSSISSIVEDPRIESVQLTQLRQPVDLDRLVELPALHNLEISGYPARQSLWRISKPLPQLRSLVLTRMGSTDREIKRLRLFPRLERLYARSASISDDGLRQFAHTPRLRELRLGRGSSGWQIPSGPWLTGRTLDSLSACPELEVLDLSGTNIRGEHLVGLLMNTQLRELYLSGTQVDDEGCETLALLPMLEKLELSFTKVGDVGLQHLRRSPRLRYLELRYTQVTDSGLSHLASHRTLRRVNVYGAKATDQAVQKLYRTLSKSRESESQPSDNAQPFDTHLNAR